MATAKKTPVEVKPSVLLSKEANDKIFSLLGPKCQALSTGVADVLTTDDEDAPTNPKDWQRLHPGVVVILTKDYTRRSYYTQIYSFVEWIKVNEYLFAKTSTYHTPSKVFHHFQAEGRNVALHFGSDVDAENFHKAVQVLLASKLKRQSSRSRPPTVPPPPRPPQSAPTSGTQPQNEDGDKAKSKEGERKEEKAEEQGVSPFAIMGQGDKSSPAKKRPVAKKISKEMIGNPTNFQHVYHVGGSSDFSLDHKELQAVFSSKGDAVVRPAPPPPPPPPRKAKPSRNKDTEAVRSAESPLSTNNTSFERNTSSDSLDISVGSMEGAILDSTSVSSFPDTSWNTSSDAVADTSASGTTTVEDDLIRLDSPQPSSNLISDMFSYLDDFSDSIAEAVMHIEKAQSESAQEVLDPPNGIASVDSTFPEDLPGDPNSSESFLSENSSYADSFAVETSATSVVNEAISLDDAINILKPPTPPPPRRRTNRSEDTGRPPDHPPPPPPP